MGFRVRVNRRIFGPLFDIALVLMWLASAVGHAWLLGDRWANLTLWQAALTGLGVVLSLALAHWTPRLRSKPMCLLIVALLVCLAHAPNGDLIDPLIQATPALVTALGLLALSELGSLRRSLIFAAIDLGQPLPGAQSLAPRWISLSLFSRPPPQI